MRRRLWTRTKPSITLRSCKTLEQQNPACFYWRCAILWTTQGKGSKLLIQHPQSWCHHKGSIIHVEEQEQKEAEKIRETAIKKVQIQRSQGGPVGSEKGDGWTYLQAAKKVYWELWRPFQSEWQQCGCWQGYPVKPIVPIPLAPSPAATGPHSASRSLPPHCLDPPSLLSLSLSPEHDLAVSLVALRSSLLLRAGAHSGLKELGFSFRVSSFLPALGRLSKTGTDQRRSSYLPGP